MATRPINGVGGVQEAAPVKGETRAQAPQHGQPASVSIIMPVYERPEFLALALEQVQQTSYEGGMEIIVMDDSEKALDESAISDFSSSAEGRIALVYRHLDRHVTVGEKRNMACELASGEIVVMMDDDDVYSPDRIAYQIKPITSGLADMTVLRQGVWLQLYGDGRPSKFFQATPRMERSVHYGTLAFRREVWNPELGTIYADASLLDEVDFYEKVKATSSPTTRVLEMPNNGMHVYVRHPNNINRPGTDLARDPRFGATTRPSNVPLHHVARLEQIVAGMNSRERELQSRPRCGACIEVNGTEMGGDGRCVSADDCWGKITVDNPIQDWGAWDRCTSQDSPCTGCDKSSDDICEDRCVLIGFGPCKTLAQCYGMYADYPPIDCDRFSTCDCDSVELPTDPPTEDESRLKCGSCVDANGCITADECWDMYTGTGLVWNKCMGAHTGVAGSTCSGCKKSPDDLCEERCVSANGPCKTFDECHDMYSNSPEIDCDRFPSCDCDPVELPTNPPNVNSSDIPKCGTCVDVNGPCVTADECWDMYRPPEVWDRCMESSGITGSPCSGCTKSSDDICEDRCVRIGFGPCKSLAGCYDMYADSAIDCDRFQTCDCNSFELTIPPTKPPHNVFPKCGACIDNYGVCITADECWDMYVDNPAYVWDQCMDVSGSTSSPCSGCRKSSDDICEERCVSANGPCKTIDDCYDMYANYSDIDCDRFPSCDCSLLDFDTGLTTVSPDWNLSVSTAASAADSTTTQTAIATSESVAGDSDNTVPQILTPGSAPEAQTTSGASSNASTTTQATDTPFQSTKPAPTNTTEVLATSKATINSSTTTQATGTPFKSTKPAPTNATEVPTTSKATANSSTTTQATGTSFKPTKPVSTNNTDSPSNEPTAFPTIADFDTSRGWITWRWSNYAKVATLVVGAGVVV